MLSITPIDQYWEEVAQEIVENEQNKDTTTTTTTTQEKKVLNYTKPN